MEIKIDAKSISSGVMSEMEKWGNLGREVLTSSSQIQSSHGMGVSNKNNQTVERKDIK